MSAFLIIMLLLALYVIEIISEMLKTIQQLLALGGDSAGVNFVPYFRQVSFRQGLVS